MFKLNRMIGTGFLQQPLSAMEAPQEQARPGRLIEPKERHAPLHCPAKARKERIGRPARAHAAP